MIRYRRYSEFLKSHFGEKVFKIALDAGFTCPNRDGTVARGGCTFCAEGSRAAYVNPVLPLTAQLEAGMAKYRQKYSVGKFLAYFQAYTNTHGPVELLRRVFTEPLSHPDVVGLCIGTRPDCVGDEVLDLLHDLSQRHYLLLEMGIPSFNKATLKWTNRGHDATTFSDAVRRATARGIRVCAHIILGLPAETTDSVISTARKLSGLLIDGIKIHNLHILRNTPLAEVFRRGNLKMISLTQYTQRVRYALENLAPSVWIHRLTGEAPAKEMLAPDWAFDKTAVLNAIQMELKENNSWQGKFL